MKVVFKAMILFFFISFFISCDKKDSESNSDLAHYSYLDEPGFNKEGLIGYYPFNGDIKDYSGHANHVSASYPTFSVDRYKHSAGAVHFNGIDDFLLIPNIGKSLDYNEGTIIIWVKNDTSFVSPNKLQPVVYSMVDSINTCFLLSSNINYLAYSIGIYPNLGFSTFLSGINNDGFNLFVLSFTDNSITVYNSEYGGYSKETRSNPKYSFGFNGNREVQDLYLGKSIIDTFNSDVFDHFFTYFKGDIDDLLIYNRILKDNEIEYFFNLAKH